ncbi:MAG: prolyl oligopeptidase family serine peptidase [Alistipes indistinctus]
MAAQGYVVVAPNRRGLPSFGQEWLDQISGDYSGQNIRDYPERDRRRGGANRGPTETRMGCVGASYGGYSVYFLAGNHQKRFKAFIAHCGMFNFESMYCGDRGTVVPEQRPRRFVLERPVRWRNVRMPTLRTSS